MTSVGDTARFCAVAECPSPRPSPRRGEGTRQAAPVSIHIAAHRLPSHRERERGGWHLHPERGRHGDSGHLRVRVQGFDQRAMQGVASTAIARLQQASQGLLGVMLTERATGAIVVTSGEFTPAALKAASRASGITRVGGAQLRAMVGPMTVPAAARSTADAAPTVLAIPAARTRRRVRQQRGPSIAALLVAVAAGLAFRGWCMP